MRFSLKDVGADVWSHDRSPDVRLMCDREILFSPAVPQLLFPCCRVVLVEIKLIIGLFSVFEIMEPQGNYIDELYGLG
jgi:hypothetical protein